MSKTTKDFSQLDSYDESKIVLLGVPWEVTALLGGSVNGLESILKLSTELESFDPEIQQNPRTYGMYFHILNSLKERSDELRPLAEKVIFEKDRTHLEKINQACSEMVQSVREETRKILNAKKHFGLIGGDHSTVEGAIVEICKHHNNDVGLLHFDAHPDMFNAYQGFKHSHASVMRNIVQSSDTPQTIVQVGIRDLCEEEHDFIKNHPHIHCTFDYEIKNQLFKGRTWEDICDSIIEKLPNNIYISLDVDVMTWTYAPHTGYPVPGGLTYDQITFLLSKLSGKNLVGFDVNEVARPTLENFSEWNAIVGTRLVYKLCNLILKL